MGVVLPMFPEDCPGVSGLADTPAVGAWASLTLGDQELDVEVVSVPVDEPGCEGLGWVSHGPLDGTDQRVWVRPAPFLVAVADLGAPRD